MEPVTDTRLDTDNREAYMVTLDKVDPVRVENVVRDRPGTLVVLAFNVETVSVEASVILFPEKVDAVIVEAVNELPISVENEVSDRPGTLVKQRTVTRHAKTQIGTQFDDFFFM